MAKRRAPKPTRLGGKPSSHSWLYRLLRGISDNLGNLLRLALVLGFAAILDPLLSKIEFYVDSANQVAEERPEETVATTLEAPIEAPAPQSQPTDAEMDEGWKFARNCTHKEFRDANFDACFPDGTTVYERPKADENEGSFLFSIDQETLYASR